MLSSLFYSTGSLQEKEVLERVQKERMKLGEDTCPPSCEPGDPLHLFLDAPSSQPLRGNGRLSVALINPTDKEKEVELVIAAQAVYYNGVLATGLWRQKQFLMLGPNQGNSLAPADTLCTHGLSWAPPMGLQRQLLAPWC